MADVPITAEITVDRDKAIAEMRAAAQEMGTVEVKPIEVPIAATDKVTAKVDEIVRENSGKEIKLHIKHEGGEVGGGEGEGGESEGLDFRAKRLVLHQASHLAGAVTGSPAVGEGVHAAIHMGEEMGLQGAAIGAGIGATAMVTEAISKAMEATKAIREEQAKYNKELEDSADKWKAIGHAQTATSKAGSEARSQIAESREALNSALEKSEADSVDTQTLMDKEEGGVENIMARWNSDATTASGKDQAAINDTPAAKHRRMEQEAIVKHRTELIAARKYEKAENEQYSREQEEDSVSRAESNAAKVAAAEASADVSGIRPGIYKDRAKLESDYHSESIERTEKATDEKVKIEREFAEKQRAIDHAKQMGELGATFGPDMASRKAAKDEVDRQAAEDTEELAKQKAIALANADNDAATASKTAAIKHKAEAKELDQKEAEETLQLHRRVTESQIDLETDAHQKRRDKLKEKHAEELQDAVAKHTSSEQIELMKVRQSNEDKGLEREIAQEKALNDIQLERVGSVAKLNAKEAEQVATRHEHDAALTKLQESEEEAARLAKEADTYKGVDDEKYRNAKTKADAAKVTVDQQRKDLGITDVMRANDVIEGTRQTLLKATGNELAAQMESIKYKYEGVKGVTGQGDLGGSIGSAGENTETGKALRQQEQAEMKALMMSQKPVFESATQSWYEMQKAGLGSAKLPGFAGQGGAGGPGGGADDKSKGAMAWETTATKMDTVADKMTTALTQNSGIVILGMAGQQ